MEEWHISGKPQVSTMSMLPIVTTDHTAIEWSISGTLGDVSQVQKAAL